MLLPHGAIVAVVDGRHFELFRNSGNEAEPALATIDTPGLDEHDKSAGVHHDSSTANPSGHLLDEDAHVAAVVTWLNAQVGSGKIGHLVVVAPPRALGEMRRHYSAQLERILVKEIPKDLASRGGKEILAAIRA